MRRRLIRPLFQLGALAAALLCAVVLIEWPRSFYRSDTISVVPVTVVAHRGSLYLLPSIDLMGFETRAVTGAPPWPLMGLPISPRAWRNEAVLGFNGWIEGLQILLQCPIWFVAPALALLAAFCYRRQAEIVPRTNYLACPACGHLLVGVVHWRCPECGRPTQSRLIEALPADAASRRPPRRRDDVRPSTGPQIGHVRV
jgi:hypothetical protein